LRWQKTKMKKPEKLHEIPIKKIIVKDNVRIQTKNQDINNLMHDLKHRGLLQPIGVIPQKDGYYEYIYGYRRIIAAKKLGWKTIKARLYPGTKPEEKIDHNIAENLQRVDVTAYELGRQFHILKEKHGLSNSELASKYGLSVHKIKDAIQIYDIGMPKNLRSKVGYTGYNVKAKKGIIPVTTTLAVYQAGYMLTTKQKEELLLFASKEDLALGKVKHLAMLMKKGLSLKEAMRNYDDLVIFRVDLVMDKHVLKKFKKRHGIKSNWALAKKVFSREISVPKGLLL